LLDQEDIAGTRIRQEAEQLRAGQLRAALILDIVGRDVEAVLNGEGFELLPSAAASCSLVEALREPPSVQLRWFTSFWFILDCQRTFLSQ
jgi:hypothetical protein